MSPVAGFAVTSVSSKFLKIWKWDATDSNANGGGREIGCQPQELWLQEKDYIIKGKTMWPF